MSLILSVAVTRDLVMSLTRVTKISVMMSTRIYYIIWLIFHKIVKRQLMIFRNGDFLSKKKKQYFQWSTGPNVTCHTASHSQARRSCLSKLKLRRLTGVQTSLFLLNYQARGYFPENLEIWPANKIQWRCTWPACWPTTFAPFINNSVAIALFFFFFCPCIRKNSTRFVWPRIQIQGEMTWTRSLLRTLLGGKHKQSQLARV